MIVHNAVTHQGGAGYHESGVRILTEEGVVAHPGQLALDDGVIYLRIVVVDYADIEAVRYCHRAVARIPPLYPVESAHCGVHLG